MRALDAAGLLLKHEISGAPVVDEQGRLIGVCNFADPQDKAGLFAAPRTIQGATTSGSNCWNSSLKPTIRKRSRPTWRSS